MGTSTDAGDDVEELLSSDPSASASRSKSGKDEGLSEAEMLYGFAVGVVGCTGIATLIITLICVKRYNTKDRAIFAMEQENAFREPSQPEIPPPPPIGPKLFNIPLPWKNKNKSKQDNKRPISYENVVVNIPEEHKMYLAPSTQAAENNTGPSAEPEASKPTPVGFGAALGDTIQHEEPTSEPASKDDDSGKTETKTVAPKKPFKRGNRSDMF